MLENALCGYLQGECVPGGNLDGLLCDCCLVGVAKASNDQINFRTWEAVLLNEERSQFNSKWTARYIGVGVSSCVIVPGIDLNLQGELVVEDVDLKAEGVYTGCRMSGLRFVLLHLLQRSMLISSMSWTTTSPVDVKLPLRLQLYTGSSPICSWCVSALYWF